MRIEFNPADLRHPVEIQYKSESGRDGAGAVTYAWTKLYKVPMGLWPYRGKEFATDGRLLSQGLFNARMRWRSGITQAMRLVYGTRVFEILSMANIEERNVIIDFVVKEEL